ncbi:inhibitory synaptic factor 2A isoform X2 [Electrophorus electricus]|uniref:Inhibitory synaptic factor 2A n=1 Tax=Electrophorus electricus TaxID=8005 RepID=A0A4W4GEJ6_ELEEL|nr:inhibitory synaptic factor 2A isoform X2 [Electrophorus electricus]
MVSKEAGRFALSNSESDSECGGPTLGGESGVCADVARKRNKALQVRFKDICEAQNEVARLARVTRGRSVSCKIVHRRYMTMPARRSIPNVTKSTAVQTSPDLRKRYQTFPFERKKGHTIKHTALVENYQGQNNGFLSDVKGGEEEQPCSDNVQKTRVLLHSMPPCSNMQDLCTGPDCPENKLCPSREMNTNSDQLDLGIEGGTQGGRSKHKGLPNESEEGAGQGPICSKTSSSTYSMQPLQDRGGTSKVTGPIAWTSLTQVECLESPSTHCKRITEAAQLNGLQSQAREALQAHYHGGHGSMDPQVATSARKCVQVIPLPGVEGDVKARLQAMETLISSSQETIKVLLGVIQELEKGEAQREGLSYRTGQDTANCDTCRNSACIIYSVELDFKLQEDKLQPLMKRLCPTVDLPYTSLPYSQEVFTSTPKRKSKTEAKKHARWKLWFL